MMKRIFIIVFIVLSLFGGALGYERITYFNFGQMLHKPKVVSYTDKTDLENKIELTAKECKQTNSSYILELVEVDDNKTIGRCGSTFSLSAKYYSFNKR